MDVCVINQSTVVSDTDAETMVAAVAKQVHDHARPAWDWEPCHVVFSKSGTVHKDHYPMYLLDNADQAGALGYHDQDPEGNPYGRVFAKTVLDNGGQALHTANSVSGCLSHEVLELLGDRDVNLWADDGQGVEFAYELCDPIEMNTYDVEGVAVSDFVLPAYFDSAVPAGTKVDYLGVLGRPFALGHDGYVIVRKGGAISQSFGSRYPEWKRATKQFPAARTARRLAEVAS